MKDKHQRYKELSGGNRYGKLTVLRYVETNKYRDAIWECICDCGNTKFVSSKRLNNGGCLSCGCLRLERLREAKSQNKKDDIDLKLHSLWRNMISRCYNINSDDYVRYGDRGIKVCDEWLNDFDSFKEWALNNGYKIGLTIDRENNNGNYEPKNCRFVDRVIQANNTRNSIYYFYNGEKHTLAEWSRIYKIPKATVWNRIKNLGWNIEKALNTPVRR